MTNYKKARIAPLTACLILFGLNDVHAADCGGEAARQADASYQTGLADYRKGRLDVAYAQLKSAFELCAGVARYRNDFLVAAVSDGHADAALAAAAPLDAGTLPPYVLEALGRGARDSRNPELALRYFGAIPAAANNPSVRVGRDLALAEAGRTAEAQVDLLELDAHFPGRPDVLEALGLADEAQGEWIPALASAEALLRIAPEHPGALALRYRVLVRVGAPQLADALTPPSVTTPAQRSATEQTALAFEFRWARDEPRPDRQRAADLDAVIARMHAAVADASTSEQARRGLRADLAEALQERGRASESAAEYASMVRDGIPVPPHATGAAADAYLTLRQPERSIELFRSLPPDSKPSFGISSTYFYALLESGRYADAVAWADELAAQEPMYLDAATPGLRTENPDYVAALVLAGIARAYTDRLADAQRRIGSLVDRAPGNQDANLALAEVQALRGWPRESAATAAGVLQLNPELGAATAKLFAAQLQMASWSAAHATLGELAAARPPEDPTLVRDERAWQLHDAAEFSVDAQLGRSYGQRAGLVDSTIEEYAYTAPIERNYRAYVHLNQTEGNPVQGDTYRHAVGAGVEYHTADWLATAELLEIDRQGPAPQVSVAMTPDDRWRLGASYQARTLDLPIAAVVVGVHADRTSLDVGYRCSELREFGADLRHEQFSDSNSRYEALGFWRERWLTGPVYKLDTRLDLDMSRNTLDNTNYFNPTRDLSASVTVQNQWLQFRRYDRSLSHELDIIVGDYRQQGFGAGLVAAFRYSLAYEINDRAVVKAGLGRGIRPYDGSRERLDVITLNALGRF